MVAVALYFLGGSTAPTADVKASYNSNVKRLYVGDIEPGSVLSFRLNRKPVLIWRRSRQEIAAALVQLNPQFSVDEVLTALEDGSLLTEIGAEEFTSLEWLVLSPVNVGGIGCLVTRKTGDTHGFHDPCNKSDFDLWGRAVEGSTTENLKIVPSRFIDDNQIVLLDVTDMPSTDWRWWGGK